MIDVKALILGYMGTNTYIITDKATGDTAIVDPACADDALTSNLEDAGTDKIRYILLTHGHFDHIGGALYYSKRFGAKIVISKEDSDFLTAGSLNLSSLFGKPLESFLADIILSDGDTLNLGKSSFEFLLTPGHTRGSGCFVFSEDKIIFSGDTLFYRSIGRTDFPTSDPAQMLSSLRRLRDLQGDYRVYPGHDRATTLSSERENNPYLR